MFVVPGNISIRDGKLVFYAIKTPKGLAGLGGLSRLALVFFLYVPGMCSITEHTSTEKSVHGGSGQPRMHVVVYSIDE